jgi:outer membrane protein assembly factor BamB
MKLYLSLFIITLSPSLAFADWLGFRGTHGNGLIHGDVSPDLSLSAETSWNVSLPGRGLSSPVLVGNLVFLTASSGPQQTNLHVLAFDTQNGEKAWERIFKATGRTICHKKTCVAASTIVSDGSLVVAQFSSNDVFCLDMRGNLMWLRGLTYDYPNIANGLGMSSSPLIASGVLIAQVENDADSFTFGLNLKNGTTLWKKVRPRGANWTSPVTLKKSSVQWVGLQSKEGLAFINPSNGEILWNYEDGASTIPSSVVSSNNVVLIPSNGLTAMEEPDAGMAPKQIWRNNKLAPGTGSPSVSGDQVFVINRANVLTSASVETGEINWRLRIKGPISGSPIVTNQNLFIFNEEGLCQVIDISLKSEAKVLKEIDLKETILCTPAADQGSLFVRSDRKLWKIGPASNN